MAFAKSQLGAGTVLPRKGTVFVSVREADKDAIVAAMRELVALGLPHSRHARHASARWPSTASPASRSTRCWRGARTSST